MADKSRRSSSKTTPPAPTEQASNMQTGASMAADRQNMPATKEEPGMLDKVGGFFSGVGSSIKSGAESAYHGLTDWHFEGREELNGGPPTYEELTAPDSEWQKLPESMSIFHDNGEGAPEMKFIHPDGREAVIDGDTLEPVTDAEYMPTYNYVNPMDWEDAEGVGGVAEFALRGAGHLLTDVLPYALGGNVRGEH